MKGVEDHPYFMACDNKSCRWGLGPFPESCLWMNDDCSDCAHECAMCQRVLLSDECRAGLTSSPQGICCPPLVPSRPPLPRLKFFPYVPPPPAPPLPMPPTTSPPPAALPPPTASLPPVAPPIMRPTEPTPFLPTPSTPSSTSPTARPVPPPSSESPSLPLRPPPRIPTLAARHRHASDGPYAWLLGALGGLSTCALVLVFIAVRCRRRRNGSRLLLGLSRHHDDEPGLSLPMNPDNIASVVPSPLEDFRPPVPQLESTLGTGGA